MTKKVFVSGCYDLLHSGHIEFFRQAAALGELHVGIGSDATVAALKHHPTLIPERERLFMVQSIRYVAQAYINPGSGMMDFVPTVERVRPDIFVVNADGATPEKERFCRQRGIDYVVLDRTPAEGLAPRSSTALKETLCRIPTRVDLAGTWIDQPAVSRLHPGWALTASLEPTFPIPTRSGLSTSTRDVIRSIWPLRLPDIEPATLAQLVFCYENHPEKRQQYISGAQDAIGICVPGICRHHYAGHYWPDRIERMDDPAIVDWLEAHLALLPLEPRRPDYDTEAGSRLTADGVARLAAAADACWQALGRRDLPALADAWQASFQAQLALFPAMLPDHVRRQAAPYLASPHVLAHKLTGAGGGGFLAVVADDRQALARQFPQAILPTIRRQ